MKPGAAPRRQEYMGKVFRFGRFEIGVAADITRFGLGASSSADFMLRYFSFDAEFLFFGLYVLVDLG